MHWCVHTRATRWRHTDTNLPRGELALCRGPGGAVRRHTSGVWEDCIFLQVFLLSVTPLEYGSFGSAAISSYMLQESLCLKHHLGNKITDVFRPCLHLWAGRGWSHFLWWPAAPCPLSFPAGIRVGPSASTRQWLRFRACGATSEASLLPSLCVIVPNPFHIIREHET